MENKFSKKLNIVRGVKLWNRAKKLIPGGTQLLSKRSEMFLPDGWPSYYAKAKGVNVWDLDGNRYIDMSLMGVGSCILGYADPDVNRAVKRAIDAGSMNTLNSPEEVELADVLLELHPWAGMARFGPAGHAKYMTIRTIGPDSKGWRIPAVAKGGGGVEALVSTAGTGTMSLSLNCPRGGGG